MVGAHAALDLRAVRAEDDAAYVEVLAVLETLGPAELALTGPEIVAMITSTAHSRAMGRQRRLFHEPEQAAESLADQLRQFGWRAFPPHGWDMRHPKCAKCGNDADWICHMQFAGSALFCNQHAREEHDFDSFRDGRAWGLIAQEQDAAMANFLRMLAGETFQSATEAEIRLREVSYRPGELDGRVLPDNFRSNAYMWALSNGWVQSDGRSVEIRDPKQ